MTSNGPHGENLAGRRGDLMGTTTTHTHNLSSEWIWWFGGCAEGVTYASSVMVVWFSGLGWLLLGLGGWSSG